MKRSSGTLSPSLLVGMYFGLTIVNYSFGQYSLNGTLHAGRLLPLIQIARALIPLVIVLHYAARDPDYTRKILGRNWDIPLLGVFWMLSGVVNGEGAGPILYGVLGAGCWVMCLLHIGFTALHTQRLSAYLLQILKPVLWGNCLVVLLLLGSIPFSPLNKGFFQPVYTSNSFWAYPLLIVGILILIRMRFATAAWLRQAIWLAIFILILVCLYLSARRTPLITCFVCGLLSYLPIRYKGLIAALFWLSLLFFLTSDFNLKKVSNYLPDSYAKYRLERMAGLNRKFKESSVSDRRAIWRHYLKAFSDRPILGYGLGLTLRPEHRETSRIAGFSPHNSFIGAMAETGIVGTLLLLYAIFNSLYYVVSKGNAVWTRIYLLLFLPTLTINWFEYNLMPGQIFFLYSALIWVIPRGVRLIGTSGKNA